MKTTEDLRKIIPAIVAKVESNTHMIGQCYPELDEDGCSMCHDYAYNTVGYEEDGWNVEVTYKCCAATDDDLEEPAHGEVTELTAYHYDEDTEEETEFNDDDLGELLEALNIALDSIS